jgi:hypothetical protein
MRNGDWGVFLQIELDGLILNLPFATSFEPARSLFRYLKREDFNYEAA